LRQRSSAPSAISTPCTKRPASSASLNRWR
jgi:hypothetical protein